ncbi:MAG: class I SAM-dependent methyltransferase [Lachnospiraceae bacterium]|nr:class I SAM-dependent methyltransferase [Robinsoniella sp.]MDY3767950.1 class I SAM-dependent methyltransferase [Lachnospiraceae bacterium]
MHYGVELEDYGEKWRQAMKEWTGGYSKRTSDDEEERKFWHDFMKEKKTYRQDEYARPIAQEMEKLISQYHPDTILEIGPGWGNYTFMLAQLCKEMYCTDISGDVLAYIKRIGEERGQTIHTIETKWENYEGSPRDITVGFNCFYRMREIERCLKKINHCSKKLCVIGMTSGPEQAYYREMEQKLGLKIKYHRLDYIYLYNLLYQMGIDCNVKMIRLKKTYTFQTIEEAVERESRRILSEKYDREEVKKILISYLQKGEDGTYFFEHDFCAAMLYWEPQNLIE